MTTLLDKHWQFLSAKNNGTGWFDANLPPPQMDYLLSLNGEGVLPRGRVGMLAARGGTGKSHAMIELAVAVASGTQWLGHFDTPKPNGNILLALGEEEEDEVWRRTRDASEVAGLSDRQTRMVGNSVIAMALAGENVALTKYEHKTRATAHTQFHRELKANLKAQGRWALIVLDPLSRFGGPNVELDVTTATTMVQLLEDLTKLPGNPTVLFAHHMTKASSDNTKTKAGDARGSSAITDAIRWQANMTEKDKKPWAVELLVTKNNYGPKMEKPVKLNKVRRGTLVAYDAD